jgi:hypothetical protein
MNCVLPSRVGLVSAVFLWDGLARAFLADAGGPVSYKSSVSWHINLHVRLGLLFRVIVVNMTVRPAKVAKS